MSTRLTKGKALVGALQSAGAVTVDSGGLTVTAGGVTITAGGLTATTGSLTVSGGNIISSVGDVKASASTGAGWFPYGVYTDTGGAARHKIIVIPIGPIAGTTDTDSAVDLPSNGVVRDAWCKITTAASGAFTLDIGLLAVDGGTTNGFLTAIDTSATGVKNGSATLSSTGTNGATAIYSITRGPYLASASSGTTGSGYYARKDYPIDTKSTALSVSYSLSTASAAIRGNIYLDVIAL